MKVSVLVNWCMWKYFYKGSHSKFLLIFDFFTTRNVTVCAKNTFRALGILISEI